MNAPARHDIERWQRFQSDLNAAGHRRLVILEGNRQAAVDWLAGLLPHLPVSSGLWVGKTDAPSIDGLQIIPAKQARRWLGQEVDCVVWDGWQGNPPDGLAALAGTLRAGGLMIWLMPELDRWAGFDDPDYRRVGLDASEAHPFARRMARVVAEECEVIRCNPETGAFPDLPELVAPSTPFDVATTREQSELIEQVVKTGLGRRRRPLVITADRGRGKSAALGMAARRLIAEGRQQVVVTASTPEAVETLLRHAEPSVSEGQVRYLSVPDLLSERPNAELVLVDEAAGIPPDRLKQILLGWPRVVFATTVHGYEGAGRGFSVRFRSVLDRETPHWKKATLQTPIRWSESDPLEPLINRLFLLKAQAPDTPTRATFQESALRIERWLPAQASDEALSACFGLLVDAHYRTTPGDLRQWMDDPAAVSWRAVVDGKVVGVLWATVEGGLSPDLAQAVMLGRRRMRGHLLPQSLASHSGFANAAQQTILRVVRVAVSAEARHRGIGRTLVAAARDHVESNALDALGTSFGGTPELLCFWQSAGLQPVRLGLSREASSGELPLQMLSAVSVEGHGLSDALRRRLADHWLTLVPTLWPDLEAHYLLALTASLPADDPLSEDDLRDLHSFAFGHRGFDLALPVLRAFSLADGVAKGLMEAQAGALWARAVMQGWSWPTLQDVGLCLGREEGEGRLRAAVRKLLQNRPDL